MAAQSFSKDQDLNTNLPQHNRATFSTAAISSGPAKNFYRLLGDEPDPRERDQDWDVELDSALDVIGQFCSEATLIEAVCVQLEGIAGGQQSGFDSQLLNSLDVQERDYSDLKPPATRPPKDIVVQPQHDTRQIFLRVSSDPQKLPAQLFQG